MDRERETASRERVTVPSLVEMKERGRKIVMVTAYDYPMARLADEAGVDSVLVGDSLGNAVLGFENSLPVTMADMLRHTQAVARGARRPLIVADMPFLSYQGSPDEAVINAGLLLKEGKAQAVKLEGGRSVAPLVERMVNAGIPVMGHIGLQPQSIHQFGRFRAQGKNAESARRLLDDAQALEDAGAFSVVLELVPFPLAEALSSRLAIPTIGIGAGAGCDGQVQVSHDLLGLGDFVPRHARPLVDLRAAIRAAFEIYAADVRSGTFPGREHSVDMETEELRKALADDHGA